MDESEAVLFLDAVVFSGDPSNEVRGLGNIFLYVFEGGCG